MTKKDFDLLAETVRTHQWRDDYERFLFASHLASKLEKTNPRFDRDRFIRACGITTKAS